MLNLENGTALPFQPLVFWDHCTKHPDVYTGHCYFFDIPEKDKGVFSFKAVGYPCTLEISVTNQYRALAEKLVEYKDLDPKIDLLEVGDVQDVSEE